MGSVADGLQPARDDDILELDECWTDEREDLRLWAVKQAVALGGSLPSNSASRGKCARGPFCQNLCSPLGPDSTKPRLKEYRQGRSFSDFWKSSEATASQVFEKDPTHRQVGKSSGEMACAQTVLRATATEAGPTGPANPSGLSVRPYAPSDDKAVRGMVQRSRHLTSTRYPVGKPMWRYTSSPNDSPAADSSRGGRSGASGSSLRPRCRRSWPSTMKTMLWAMFFAWSEMRSSPLLTVSRWAITSDCSCPSSHISTRVAKVSSCSRFTCRSRAITLRAFSRSFSRNAISASRSIVRDMSAILGRRVSASRPGASTR